MLFKRRMLSQNFFKQPKLVASLVGKAHFGQRDLILDIGAGTGIISKELAKTCGQVIAVELDVDLIPQLKANLRSNGNVRICHEDIRQFNLPTGEYKVFANLPFHITADVIYKLLYYSNPPEEAYLVVQKEAAEKFAGLPHETQFSILAKPWFDFEIVWKFKRLDFTPEPEVDTVFLKISKRELSKVLPENEALYKSFIKFAFNTWKKDLKVGLKDIFTYEQWKRLARDNHFNVHAKPTDLTFPQWFAIFDCLITRVNREKYERIKV